MAGSQYISKNVPYRDKVYDVIKENIILGIIKPGEHLIETELSEKFNISRSPIREALRKLESDGLVETISSHGTYVKTFTDSDIREIYDIRKVLGLLALSKAINSRSSSDVDNLRFIIDSSKDAYRRGDVNRYIALNHEFHNFLIELGKLSRVRNILDNISAGIKYFSALNLRNEGRIEESIREHELILDALVRRDEDALEKAYVDHVNTSRDGSLAEYNKIYNSKQ